MPGTADAALSESYGKLPLHFEENRGQADPQVRFLARGPGYGLYLTAGDAVLALDGAVLRMALVGANPESAVKGLDELPGKANYFIGRDSSKWRTNVPTYAKVRYREVYPGIDLVYYGNQRRIEYDFVVAPGADPKRIALQFDGAQKLEIDAKGDLVLRVGKGTVRVKKPLIYQDIQGKRQEIVGRYVVRDEDRVGFRLAAYDGTKPLVIDPILAYSTYLGGSAPALHARGSDLALAIAADRLGNAYVTGRTATLDFPTTPDSVQPGAATPTDAFVAKLNPSGTALVYSTYLGGGGADIGRGIAIDAQGNAYVTGHTTSTDVPTTPGVLNAIGGSGFAAKLDPAGARLVYSTYLPAGGDGLALDAGGNAYITGQTDSSAFPITPGAVQPVFGGGTDAFVLKLDPTGTLPLYATFLGGSGSEAGFGIAVDAQGSAYVTGYTDSVDFRTTPGALQPIIHGPSDAFVTKLDATGTALVYSTYLGGHQHDIARAIALDTGRSAYVTGGTTSTDFPTTPGAFQEVFPGAYGPAFVAKLSAAGSALAYATYLSGSADWGGGINASGSGIAVCAAGHACVTGYTFTTDFPTTPDAAQPAIGGGWDAFVTIVDGAGSSLVYSTFLGGNLGDEGSAIAVDAAGGVYVAGGTSSANFPTTPGAVQPVYAGGGADSQFNSDGDAFVARFGNAP
jgi:hypothetical protein